MAVVWAQLLLLAGIIVMSASQSCDDVICCSGKVCVEETTGRSGRNRTRCITPTTCDQLDCPTGFVCRNETRGTGSSRTRVSCQASCDNVQCPMFLQCVERGSSTECIPPPDCLLVECPPGTACQLLQKGNEIAAVCLGESCDTVDCFNGSECFDETSLGSLSSKYDTSKYDKSNSDTSKSGTTKSDTTRSDTSKTNTSRTDTSRSMSDTSRSMSDTSRSMTDSGSAGGLLDENFAVCLPMCEGADICPQGLVCEESDYGITCREPRSCDELECPAGQECEEVTCENPRTRSRSQTNTMTMTGTGTDTRSRRSTGTRSDTSRGTGTRSDTSRGTGTRTRSNILVRCVDIDLGSGSGDENVTEAGPSVAGPSTTEPTEILSRIGFDEAFLLTNSASSLLTTDEGTVVPVVAAFALPLCVFFLLHL